jgi:hypothetical protein
MTGWDIIVVGACLVLLGLLALGAIIIWRGW